MKQAVMAFSKSPFSEIGPMSNRILATLIIVALSPLLSIRAGEPVQQPAVETVTGRVLLDVNYNGKADEHDKGVANVLVSDGIQFVRTAADGSFTLKFADDPLIPYKPAQVISVCWPSGVWPVARRFYVRRSDIKPGQSVDFLLREQKQSLPFTFAHGTDPHDNVCGGELFAADIASMKDRVKFCIMTGDLGYADRNGAEKMFSSIREATLRFPIPLLHAPGNHDICDIHTTKWSEQHPSAGYGPYTKHLGPLRYSFNYAGIHFVSLDWARIMDDGKLQTGVPDTVIEWVKKDLAQLMPETRTFVFMHHDFRHGDDKFWDVLVAHKVELVIAGHSHRNKEETRRGIPRLTTQNLCGPYRLLTVCEKGHYVVNRCFTGSTQVHQHSYAGKCKMALDFNGFKSKRGMHKEVALGEVKETQAINAFQARDLEILAEVEPGSARRFGLRLISGKSTLELAFTSDDELHIGNIQTFPVRSREDKHYRLQVIVADGRLFVQANNRVQYEAAISSKDPSTVQLFADGGAARFRKVDLWELKVEK
jgi:hypothetical protein